MGENIFEKIKKINKQGKEYWSARELYPLLGYMKWENFLTAVERAKISCRQAGEDVEKHLPVARKMLSFGNTTTREFDDYNLSR